MVQNWSWPRPVRTLSPSLFLLVCQIHFVGYCSQFRNDVTPQGDAISERKRRKTERMALDQVTKISGSRRRLEILPNCKNHLFGNYPKKFVSKYFFLKFFWRNKKKEKKVPFSLFIYKNSEKKTKCVLWLECFQPVCQHHLIAIFSSSLSSFSRFSTGFWLVQLCQTSPKWRLFEKMWKTTGYCRFKGACRAKTLQDSIKRWMICKSN